MLFVRVVIAAKKMNAKTVPVMPGNFEFTVREFGRAPKPDISIFMSLVHFFTGKWMQAGDTAPDLRNQMITEQTSISLVSALFCTISIPAVFAADGWDDDWIKGVYGFLVNFANAGLVVSVLSSVLYILAINECVSEHELKRFSTNMGFFVQVPTVAFLFGVILFGGVTMCLYCFRTYELNWFISYGACSYLGSSIVLVPTASMLVKSLYASKEGRQGLAIISRAELKKGIRQAIEGLHGGKAELAIADDVKEWLLNHANCLDFTELTERRFRKEYETVLEDLLGAEYEAEKD